MCRQPPLRQAQGRPSAVRPSESSAGSGQKLARAGLPSIKSRDSSGDGDQRRSTGGLRGEEFRGRRFCMQIGNAGIDLPHEDRSQQRFRMRGLRCSHRTAAIVITAGRAADGALVRFRDRAVTLVCRLADTAGVRWRSGCRQRERNKDSGKREQQQKSGGPTLHACCVNQNPKVGQA